MTGYITVNHGMLNAFVERWHIETSSFHLPLDVMFITLDDVSFLLHVSIWGKLLGGRISNDEALELMVEYLGVDLEIVMSEMERTRGLMLGLNFWREKEKVYKYELVIAHQARGDDEQVGLHRAYLLNLVGTVIFVDERATYTDVYLWYFV